MIDHNSNRVAKEGGLQNSNPRRARITMFAGKVFAIVLVAAFGLYLSMITVYKSAQNSSKLPFITRTLKFIRTQKFPSDSPISDSQCPQPPKLLTRNADVDNLVNLHYPQPTTYEREECACEPVLNFVIFSMQRSGSGWFETLLNNHPNISSNGEIFSVRPRRKNFTSIKSTLDRIYGLDWMSSASKNSCTNAVGLKWMLNQGAMEYQREVKDYFMKNSVSIIFLLRRNVLKRLVSILANAYDRKNKQLDGAHKSHVHSKIEAEKLANYKPVINTRHLLSNLQKVQDIAMDALHVFNGTRLMVLYYEDVVKDNQKVELAQKFLGVPVLKLESRQVKIHTKPLNLTIENFDEVEEKLRSTQFYKFLAHD